MGSIVEIVGSGKGKQVVKLPKLVQHSRPDPNHKHGEILTLKRKEK